MSSIEVATRVALKSVLVAYDFSEASHKPLHHALAIARHHGAKFYLVHVVSSLGFTIAGPEALKLATEGAWRDSHRLEQELVGSGALAGLDYEFIVGEGDVGEQLESVIREKQADLVVIGTHGRRGLEKLLLGSVAEQIFRRADCLVATVGPGSFPESLVERTEGTGPFLWPTDFGPASLRALPHAISFANQYGAKLVALNVLPPVPIPEGFHWSTTGDLKQMREKAQMASQSAFEQLMKENAPMAKKPEFMVEFGIPGDQILLAARALHADLIILGLKRPAHIRAAAHMPWEIAYRVVCGARCPVLTIRS